MIPRHEGGLWVIPHALPYDFAADVRSFLDLEMDPTWWYVAAQSFDKVRDYTENLGENARRRKSEEKTAGEGGFAYYFRRTYAHTATCDCPVCRTLLLFASVDFTRQVSERTGVEVNAIGHCFASYYAPGDFLSTHTDKDNGKLAFVWNLTRDDWRPQWGGLLHLLTMDWKRVQYTVVPTFNELVLFDVRGEGWPHLVSQVAPDVKEKRLAISGWLL